MNAVWVGASRGPLVESRHDVAVAVVDARDRLVARAGETGLVTFWRSAAKAFQVLPLIEDGGAERWAIDRQMLALGCGSHNAEPIHREVGRRWLDTLGLPEEALSCGGHASLWSKLSEEMVRQGVVPTPLWSNCSGKHAALLADALLHGWPIEGYQGLGHPVQERVADSFARWTGMTRDALVWGVDGCTAAAVALPLRRMALAYARLGVSAEPAAVLVREAMMGEPMMVAGSERIDTVLMQAWSGRLLVKAGAEGIFCAALPTLGLGVALKVLDGDMKSSALALVAVLEQLTAHLAPDEAWPLDAAAPWRAPAIVNTRGSVTGHYAVHGALRFAEPGGVE